MRHYELKSIGSRRRAADADCPDAGWKPLSNKQKARLSILAAQAAAGLNIPRREVDEWRRDESVRACGLRISEASQRHYAEIKAHFLDLAGKTEQAFTTHIREGDNKRRVALYKLNQALASAGLADGYAGAICRAKFKVNLPEASARQLWCIYYDITKRGNNRKKR